MCNVNTKNKCLWSTSVKIEVYFSEFENVFISFSRVKESALLLHLVIDYIKRNNLSTKIGVFNQEFES